MKCVCGHTKAQHFNDSGACMFHDEHLRIIYVCGHGQLIYENYSCLVYIEADTETKGEQNDTD